MSEREEGCALTGLAIKDGDPCWLVILDGDYAVGTGPASHWGQVAPPLRGFFSAEDAGIVVDRSTPEMEARYEVWKMLSGLNPAPSFLLNKRRINSDQDMWLLSEAAYKFLPEIPHHDATAGATVEKSLHSIKANLRDALKDVIGGQNREPDRSEAYKIWSSMVPDQDVTGQPAYDNWVSDLVTDKHQLEKLLSAYGDSYALHHALNETRRKFMPSMLVGPDSAGHEAVGTLARFVRRKAIAAGFTSAG